jgi:SAM-dependent methyltransferase
MDYKDLEAGHTKDNFWFKAKNDLIEILMEKVCKNRCELRILNIGVGTGDDLAILNKFGENYVIDIDKKALLIIDDELCVEKKLADACDLPYDHNTFDIIVSFDVLEHIEDDHKAISEIYRVLKNDGIMIFTVPAFQFLFSNHDEALLHQRRYNKKTIQNLISIFDNSHIFFWNSLLFILMAVMRVMKKKSKPKVDQINLPVWLNTLFYKLLSVDNFLIKKNVSMPIGLSIVGFCHK